MRCVPVYPDIDPPFKRVAKGDTLSVPHVPDPENLDDRGRSSTSSRTRGQDAGEKPSPLRHLREPKDLEEAYAVEADYELKQLAKLSDAKTRTTGHRPTRLRAHPYRMIRRGTRRSSVALSAALARDQKDTDDGHTV